MKTHYFYKNSHLEPTIVRSVEEIRDKGLKGNFVEALLRGDVIA